MIKSECIFKLPYSLWAGWGQFAERIPITFSACRNFPEVEAAHINQGRPFLPVGIFLSLCANGGHFEHTL